MSIQPDLTLRPVSPFPANGPATPRERLLAAAARLFCSQGITATGIDLVIAEAGVAKTTLYNTFGSKDRLVEAVLEREGQAWRDWFFAETNVPGRPPAEQLRAIFPVLRTWFCLPVFYGCPFINAVGEHEKSDDRLRGIVIRHKALVLKHICTLAKNAGCQSPEALAHQIGFLIDGATVAALVTRSAAVADTAGCALEALLLASLPRASRVSKRRDVAS